MKRALVLLLACGCGDDRAKVQVFEPTNGTRLTIEQYQFDDGTRLVQPTAFYDRRIHARCTPQEWIDGVIRCLPDAEEAFYREETCTLSFGRATMKFPTHFITRDTRMSDGKRMPARVFEVAAKADPIEQYFLREGTDDHGMPICTGPFTFPPPDDTTQFYDLGGEVGGEDLEEITETEIGDGRLALQIRQSSDGALVPTGFRDRDLDVACSPMPHGESSACEPIDVPSSAFFADNACTQPAILATPIAPPPSLASVATPDGCREYHPVDPTPVPRAYRDAGGTCVSAPTSLEVLPLLPAAELAAVVRTPDDAPKRRLQRILASDGDLHVYADRLFDTATRSECHLVQVGPKLRCLPTALAPIVRLFQPGCTVELRLAEVPDASCEPAAFAANNTGETIEVHAIGDAFTGTAYVFGPTFACIPYTPAPSTTLHSVGPLLPEDTFVGAVAFGAR